MPDYTYSGDPASSPKDTVRFLAKATGTTKEDGFVTDEEIQWVLREEPNVYMAAARVAEQVASFFGAKQSKTVGPLSIDYRNQASSYTTLAGQLRSQANSTTKNVGPISTGNDTVLFQVGMSDNPYSGAMLPWQDITSPWPGQ